MKEERRKEDGSGSGSESPSPPGFPPQKDVLRAMRDLLISTYSGVSSVQGARQLCSILLGDVCEREFVGRGLKSEEKRKEKS